MTKTSSPRDEQAKGEDNEGAEEQEELEEDADEEDADCAVEKEVLEEEVAANLPERVASGKKRALATSEIKAQRVRRGPLMKSRL